MSNDHPDQPLPDLPPQALSPEAEAKRRAARRKFLLRTSAGSGLLITTLYHQRSFAKKPVAPPGGGGAASRTAGTYLVSSEFACTSIGGIATATTDTSVTGVVRTKCTVG